MATSSSWVTSYNIAMPTQGVDVFPAEVLGLNHSSLPTRVVILEPITVALVGSV